MDVQLEVDVEEVFEMINRYSCCAQLININDTNNETNIYPPEIQ
jgi:hypothetical protein